MKLLLEPVPKTTVELGDMTYSEEVIATVARIIAERMEPSRPLTSKLINTIEQELDPWMPTHPEHGKIVKRVDAFLHKKYKAKLSERTRTTIGNYLASDLPPDGIVYEVTKQFDWRQGEFGDAGSCFFGNGMIPALSDSPAHALRFYRDGIKGEGRAIVLPTPIMSAPSVVVNSYGPSLTQLKTRLRLIVGKEVPLSLVTLTNFGERNLHIYINLGVGILVGDKPPASGHVDLRFELGSGSRLFICDRCGNRVTQRNTIQLGHRMWEGPRWACSACATRHTMTCPVLGDRWFRDEMPEQLVSLPNSTLRSRLFPYGYERVKVNVGPADSASSFVMHRCDLCNCLSYRNRVYTLAKNGAVHHSVCAVCVINSGADARCQGCNTYHKSGEPCGICNKQQERREREINQYWRSAVSSSLSTAAGSVIINTSGAAFAVIQTPGNQATHPHTGAPIEGRTLTAQDINAAFGDVQTAGPVLSVQAEPLGDGETDADGSHLQGQRDEDTGGGAPR